MVKILISDSMSPRAKEIFENRGIDVDVKVGLSEDELVMYTSQLARVLDYFKRLDSIDTAAVAPPATTEHRSRHYPRTLEEFEGRFATEQACREYLMQLRWPQGFVCPRCGGQPTETAGVSLWKIVSQNVALFRPCFKTMLRPK